MEVPPGGHGGGPRAWPCRGPLGSTWAGSSSQDDSLTASLSCSSRTGSARLSGFKIGAELLEDLGLDGEASNGVVAQDSDFSSSWEALDGVASEG